MTQMKKKKRKKRKKRRKKGMGAKHKAEKLLVRHRSSRKMDHHLS